MNLIKSTFGIIKTHAANLTSSIKSLTNPPMDYNLTDDEEYLEYLRTHRETKPEPEHKALCTKAEILIWLALITPLVAIIIRNHHG